MRCPGPGDLPPPPPGRAGWPWTEASPPLPATLPDGRPWPRISIVTPSYNQGIYLEETIRSVLLQGYPDLEYSVLDGGSTDGSVEIIRRYEHCLTHWTSGPDGGQARAIAGALRTASGTWFNWINSDDILLPRALATLAEVTSQVEDPQWVTGGRLLMDARGAMVDVEMGWRSDPSIIALELSNFPQDATFIKPDFVRTSGAAIREDLRNVFDTHLHFQLLRAAKPLLTTATFSAWRLHPAQKTADVARRTAEGRAVLDPFITSAPLGTRIVRRFLGTRFAPLGYAVLRCALRSGLLNSSAWRCVVYSHARFRWEVQPASKVIW